VKRVVLLFLLMLGASCGMQELPWLELLHSAELPLDSLERRCPLTHTVNRIGKGTQCQICVARAVRDLSARRGIVGEHIASMIADVHALIRVDMSKRGELLVSVYDNNTDTFVWILDEQGTRKAPHPNKGAASRIARVKHENCILLARGRSLDDPYQLVYRIHVPARAPIDPSRIISRRTRQQHSVASRDQHPHRSSSVPSLPALSRSQEARTFRGQDLVASGGEEDEEDGAFGPAARAIMEGNMVDSGRRRRGLLVRDGIRKRRGRVSFLLQER